MKRPYPPRMHRKGNNLYHVYGNQWTPLGPVDDMVAALRRYDDVELAVVKPDMQTVAGLMATMRRLIESGKYRTRDGLPLSHLTEKEYLRILKPSGKLARVFGRSTLGQVKPRHVGAYLDGHPAPIMANREIALLSKMFNYAIRRGGYEGFNPCVKIERNPKGKRIRYVEHWEYNAVFHRATVQQKIFMAFTYLCNVRESTVLAIRVRDIDKRAGHIKVVEKGGKPARVVLTPKVEEVVAWHVEQPGKDRVDKALIRVVRQGEKQQDRGGGYTADGWRANWRRLMADCIEAGVIAEPFTCHDLRAKHATDRAEKRFDVQLALGHFDESTTKTYIRHPLGRKIVPLDELPPSDNDQEDSDVR